MNSIANFWERNKSLVFGLILPLAIASLIFLYLSRPISLRDVTLNLATDLIIIIITVLYVDWVIKQQDKSKWSIAEKYIASEAAVISNAFIRDVAEALHIEDEIFPPAFSTDILEIQKSILESVAKLDRFVVEDALARLSTHKWQGLMAVVDARRSDSTPVLSQFAHRMTANQLSSILAFRQICSSILSAYSIFQPFLGVPVSDLPRVKGGKPEEYMVLAIIRLGIDIHAAFDASLAIIDEFDYVIGPIPDDSDLTTASWSRWHARSSKRKQESR